MAQAVAIRRLKSEYANLLKSKEPGLFVKPLEKNFLHAHFILYGSIFYDTPFEGGVYHGVLKFPSNYPMKPPTVILRTPSGRFEPDKKICFSMSDFHPELWNPMWNIRSILVGLVSFMNSDEITTGGVRATDAHRIMCAKSSLKFCIEKDALAMELFREELEILLEQRSQGSGWPPERPKEEEREKPQVEEKTRRRRIRDRLKDTEKQEETNKLKEEEQQSNEGSGKNAARNKKKREKEKRKKFANKFFATLEDQVPTFLQRIEFHLLKQSLDVSSFYADHVCWRTESMEEYLEIVNALKNSVDNCALLIESEVGGRSIANFKLKKPIVYNSRLVSVIEIPAPKEGRQYRSGLEHVEYVIGNAPSPVNSEVHKHHLNKFMESYSQICWNTKAEDKKINPDVSTKIEIEDFGQCSVKFHLIALEEVIEFELRQELEK